MKRNKILCPCKKCVNCQWREFDIIYEHLICEGFKNGYKLWIFHREASSSSAHRNSHQRVQVEDIVEDRDEIPKMLRDMAFGFNQTGVGGSYNDCFVDGSEDVDDFCRLIDDASKELYHRCTSFSKLNFLV